jgi:type IV pilus assembly protein PilC
MLTIKLKNLFKKINPKQPLNCHWQGITADGWRDSGVIVAQSKQAALDRLQANNITPFKIICRKASLFNKPSKINAKTIADFTRQLATLLQTGLHLLPALTIIKESNTSLSMQAIINKLIIQLNKGTSFSDALASYKKHFSDLYCGMVYAAEQTGSYATTFTQLADYLERSIELKNKIKKALFYPITVLLVTIVITAALLIFIVPQFQNVFASFDAELPFFTMAVIKLADALQTHWYIGLIALIGIMSMHKMINQFQQTQSLAARISLKLPKVGKLIKTSLVCRWTNILAALLTSGITLSRSLEITARAISHPVLQHHIMTLQQKLKRGQSLSAAMQDTAFFDHRLLAMVQVGEAAGNLSELLQKITAIYQAELDHTLNNLSKMLEPVIMMVLAVVAGGLIIAMYLPIFQIGSVL